MSSRDVGPSPIFQLTGLDCMGGEGITGLPLEPCKNCGSNPRSNNRDLTRDLTIVHEGIELSQCDLNMGEPVKVAFIYAYI